MKNIFINEGGVFAEFVINDESELCLAYMSDSKCEYHDLPQLGYKALELAISGEGFDDHHGSKHTGGIVLKYISHTDSRNKLGRLLSFKLGNGRIEARVNYQFFFGYSSC